MFSVDFAGANLFLADLRHALFGVTDKEPTNLRTADLHDADFRGATMDGVDLRGAKLGGARFCDVDGLGSARLEGATYDITTRWPANFSPEIHGAVKVSTEVATKKASIAGLLASLERGDFPPCKR